MSPQASERKVETECLIEFSHQIFRDFSNRVSKSLHRNGSDLLSLGLGVVLQSSS